MTSEDARRPTVEELADLDAGLVDGREVDVRTAARLRAEAVRDPWSSEVLDALAATRADLAAAPLPAPPPVDRWSALFDEAEPPAVVVPLPRRRRSVRPALVAAAVLAVIGVVAGIVTARAQAEAAGTQLAGEALAAMGDVRDAGGLDDPVRRAGCLRAAAPQLAATAPLFGARRTDHEGRSGILMVLGTGKRGIFTVVVVDPECGPGAGSLLLSPVTIP